MIGGVDAGEGERLERERRDWGIVRRGGGGGGGGGVRGRAFVSGLD